MSNSGYSDAGYLGCTNPCGEQPLRGFGVCNLGAISLSRFVSDGDVAWDDLGKAVRYAVRFLDDVIDATPYFFDENYAQQKAERRVGLNTMGLAERSEEHTSELQSQSNLVCRLLLEKKKKQ